MFALVIASSALSLMLGSVSIPFSELLSALSGKSGQYSQIILNIRLPRILNAVLVGACLSCAGMILQAALRNNLAEPGLLGISAGAGLGAIIVFLIPSLFSFSLLMPAAFIFAIGSTALIFSIASALANRQTGFVSANTIILTGIALSALISAVNGFLMLAAGSSLTQILYWLNGGLSGRGWSELVQALPFAVAGIAISVGISKDLNVMNFGEEMSLALGLDISRFQKLAILASSLLAASAVSVAGIVSFAGLIVPNLTRLLIGNDYRYSVPCSVLAGAAFMVISDTIARNLTAPAEIPLGIVTSFIGAPVFIWLMMRSSRNASAV